MLGCCLIHASTIDRIAFKKVNPPRDYENRWLDSQLGSIRYVLSGKSQNQCVMLMPDPPNSIEQMKPLIDILTDDFYVIAFDAPGFGYSRASSKFNYSIEHNAQIIIELIQSLCVSRAILAMTCIGALPAIYASKYRPELISGLVLGQTPSLEDAKRWANSVDIGGLLGTPYLGQALLKFARSKVSKNWYDIAFPKGYNTRSHYHNTIDSFRRGAGFSLASAFQALKSERMNTSHLVTETNAIVLWGMLDRTHKKTDRYGIMDCLSNGKLLELNNSGHFPDIEAPDKFSNAIKMLAN